MNDDILDVKLLPTWQSPSIHRPLEAALSKCALLQGAVAYWTVTDGSLGHRISPALRHDSGFMCVDIHQPTDIDALADLVKSGAHVGLFCEEIATTTDFGKREPPCLLHPKMLLFWSADKTAELWVGSHNWTRRAIFGLNVEYSVVLKLKDTSSLFCEAAEYLQHIRSICEPFDLGRVDYYKELQKFIDEPTVPVIEVEAGQADRLGGLEVTIFGTDAEDLKELGTVRRKVYLSATENDGTEAEFVYPAAITQVGALNSSNPLAGRVSFSARRYAHRFGRRLPELLLAQEVPPSTSANAEYYVTLELQQRDASVWFDYPRGRRGTWTWTEEDASPLIRRLGGEEIATLFRGRQPSLRIPTDEQSAVEPNSPPHLLPLIERRNLQERSFVTRRVIRRG
jgi:hypothetical protein